jgi:hypothetical protein
MPVKGWGFVEMTKKSGSQKEQTRKAKTVDAIESMYKKVGIHAVEAAAKYVSCSAKRATPGAA